MSANTAALPSAPGPGPSSTNDSPTTSSLTEYEKLLLTPMQNTSTNQFTNVSFSIDSSTPSQLTPVHPNPLVARGLIPANLMNVFLTPKQQKSIKMSSQVIIKEKVLTNEQWLNKIQVKKIENEEKGKTKNIQNNKQEQKRNEAVSKKKSVDNNQPSTLYEDYPMSENVETNEKHCSKQTVQKIKYTNYNLSSSKSESELSDISESDLCQIFKCSEPPKTPRNIIRKAGKAILMG